MLVKMLLMSKQQTRADGKSKFRKFFTYMDILVEGEEDKGLQLKSLTVKFDEKSGIDTSKFNRGVITLDENDYDAPYKYKVKEVVDKDGTVKKKYPHIFIKKIVSYEDRKPKSTGSFNLMDEAETEEVEIDESEE